MQCASSTIITPMRLATGSRTASRTDRLPAASGEMSRASALLSTISAWQIFRACGTPEEGRSREELEDNRKAAADADLRMAATAVYHIYNWSVEICAICSHSSTSV